MGDKGEISIDAGGLLLKSYREETQVRGALLARMTTSCQAFNAYAGTCRFAFIFDRWRRGAPSTNGQARFSNNRRERP